ncbi:MAG: DUF1565 domain-containing protein, partial [Myxococcota bacterium]
SGGATLTVERSIFVGNRGDFAGAIWTNSADPMTIRDSVFAFNTGARAGALFVGNSPGVTSTVTNATFVGNVSKQNLGTLRGETVFVEIYNSAFAFDPPGARVITTGVGAIARVGSSVLFQTSGFTDLGGNIAGGARLVDPENGDFRLAPGSPGIDSGDNGLASMSDLAGNDRVDDFGTPNTGLGAGLPSDMGALEFGGTTTLGITAPSGAEIFEEGDTITVTWGGSASGELNFEYSSDGGINFVDVTGGGAIDASAGTHTLVLPVGATPIGTLRISDAAGAVLDQVTQFFAVATDGEWFVNAASTGPTDGQTFNTGFLTIDEALAVAEFGQTIFVAEGTYAAPIARDALVVMKQGVNLFGGYGDGDGDGTYDYNPAVYETELNGFDSPATSSLVNHVVIGANNAELRDLTIRGGNDRSTVGYGGGLLIESGSMIVDTCLITNNRADNGGGIGMLPGTALLIRDSQVDLSRGGAGIFADQARLHSINTDYIDNDNDAIVVRDVDLTIEGGRFISNPNDVDVNGANATLSDVFSDGGNHFSAGSVTLERVELQNNFSDPALEGSGDADDVFELTNCVIYGTGSASAINVTGATVQVLNTSIYGTSSPGSFRGSGDFTITNSI